jgi:choline-sulfatase
MLSKTAALLALAVSAHAASTPVILISIDTLRADRLHAYGYTRTHTPFLDELAAAGTVYRNIDAQIPLTLPSHTSLFTSTYPFTNHVEGNDETLPPDAVTLASVLHAAGYRTAAFAGSIILDSRYGLDKGFDDYDSPFRTAPGQIPNPYSARIRRDAALVVRAAAQWIGANRAAPFFAFLHFYDLHTPYTLPQVASLTPSAAGYDAELEHVDRALASLRDALVRAGVWDKALVILLADHGESLGDHGETSHGYFIYESTMHVPLIVRWPAGSARPAAQISEPGGLIDVAPTILDFLHIAPPPAFRGSSLLRARTDRVVYGESVYPRDTFGWAALRSIRGGRFKYIDAPQAELYDLAQDPGERRNLIASQPAEARALKLLLAGVAAQSAAAQHSAVSPAAREVLGSLGYTAGAAQPQPAHAADPKDKLAEQESYEKGLTLLYTARYANAIATFTHILAQDPANLPARCALGDAYFRSGNPTLAIRSWHEALQRNPAYRPAADSMAAACRLSPAVPLCRQ